MLYPSAEQLRTLFDRGERLTKTAAAQRLDLEAPRSITRIVADLRAAGVPVQDEPDPSDGRRKRFFIPDEHQRRGLRLDALDEAQLLALTVAAEAARTALADTPLAGPLDTAFAALLQAAAGADDGQGIFSFEPDDEPQHWHFGAATTARTPDPVAFAALRRASARALRVRIDYIDAEEKRTRGRELSPLGLAHVRGAWRLVAYCHLREALRDFYVGDVSHVAELSTAAHSPPGFNLDAHLGAQFGGLAGADLVEVRLHVAPTRAAAFRRRRYHPSQTLAPNSDGSLTAHYLAPGGDALDAVRAFVASWGLHVIAEHPPELVRRLADDALKSTQAYHGPKRQPQPDAPRPTKAQHART